MTDCEEFYRERDRRTREYEARELRTSQPVVVAPGPEVIEGEAGQFLVLTLANLLARVHRHVDFVLPGAKDADLRVPDSRRSSSLADAVLHMSSEIDPCGTPTLRDDVPEGTTVGVGIGDHAPAGLPWYVGAKGAVAVLDTEPSPIAEGYGRGSLRGAGLAACLGSAAAFHAAHGITLLPRRLSAWNYAEGDAAELGPSTLEPIDPGRVLLVGAGAVGSALAYWLRQFGVGGSWTVVDRDVVKLHNTNRSLLFLPADAGWPSRSPRYKANIVAATLPNSTAVREWYDEADQIGEEVFDVILPLANERDVRSRIAARNATVMLHATTGQTYVSQLHRHVRGLDDCIECRMVDVMPAAMECSDVKVPSQGPADEGGDAALPSLSAASGLMLATALQRLCAGDLTRTRSNKWSWYFDSERRLSQQGRQVCRADCMTVPPRELRARNAGDRKWRDLDPAV